MNGGFERARAVFGGEPQLERVLADMNAMVFGTASAGDAPDGAASRPDKPIN
jgi:type I restriction enzyme R subunit